MSTMYKGHKAQHVRVLTVLVGQSLVTVGLFLIGVWRNNSWQDWFLCWNLFLAWLPLVFAYLLTAYVDRRPWVSGPGVILSILWLGFLPNSFYMLSDYIHLYDVPRVDPVFDVVMFTSFALSGLILGYTSLYLVHKRLIKRLKTYRAHLTVAVILLLCGFAIYLGRYFGWNSWDILINPQGILFDVSNPLLSPNSNPEAFSTSFGFFALLGSVYIVIWNFIQTLQNPKHS